TAKPLGGNIFFLTKSSGQALRVSLVKPGAYLSASYQKESGGSGPVYTSSEPPHPLGKAAQSEN
ncbi:MAG: hypothetical protein ACREBC_39255, partial [Pyrinomonadaceae bacterium]